MNSQVARQKLGNGNTRKKPAPQRCISRSLYETPPQTQLQFVQMLINLHHLSLIFLSKFVLGQHLITIFDFYMIKLEKTLDFCVPRDQLPQDMAADRPLIWIVFIPALIVLRMLRFWLSVVCIIAGKGEVTARHMQMRIVGFRRYYRSVRHYAVERYTEDHLKLKEERCKSHRFWRICYNLYERIVMTKPPVERHSNMPEDDTIDDQTDASNRKEKSNAVKKSSLNQIDDDDTSEEDMSTEKMLNEYATMKDSSADADYEPQSEEASSEETSSEGDLDTEEEKTESQRKLNLETTLNVSSGNGSFNGYSSDKETRAKSKKQKALDAQQMMDLEEQLVSKIMRHFKDNFNYSPSSALVDDVFYSPIGSPPDKGYNSDSALNQSSEDRIQALNQSIANAGQIQEVSSSGKDTSSEKLADQATSQVPK